MAMMRTGIERALARSVQNEKRLRALLKTLTGGAEKLMNLRAELTAACNRSTSLRELLRSVDLL